MGDWEPIAIERGSIFGLAATTRQWGPRPAKSHPSHLDVIPAKAGIHLDLAAKARWIPAFARMTAVRYLAIPVYASASSANRSEPQ